MCRCCSDIVRAKDYDLKKSIVKWSSACALLLDLEGMIYLEPLQDAIGGTRHLGGLQELQLRYLTCYRHKKLTTWVRS